MNENLLWRFPEIKGGSATGMTTGDRETFKKNPYKSLAREILQNSIDVGTDKNEPVEVEFKSFNVDKNSLHGHEGLCEQIERCKKFWDYKPDYQKSFNHKLGVLNGDVIHCLRISDFKTSGLRGVRSKEFDGNRFMALVKGSGVSEKGSSNAGGSKGVGKNAAIEQSEIDVIFYSTITDAGEKGTIGVASLVSGYAKGHENDTNVFTQGPGFFTNNENNEAIDEVISFDKTYDRAGRCGTDIYIFGFKGFNEPWENEVISSVIDSFLVAIYHKKLIVRINNIEISSDTLESIVNGNYISDKNVKNSAICSLRLLKGNGVQTFSLNTDYGEPTLYVLPLPKEEEELATHACTMVRYPYMKIRSFSQNRNYRVSAMCIIEDGKLCEYLRNLENPEHVDWEVNRLKSPEKEEAKAIIRSIKLQIEKIIQDVLKIDDDTAIDPNKAGDFLKSIEGDTPGQTSSENEDKGDDIVSVTQPKKKQHRSDKPIDEYGEAQGLEPDIGKQEGDGDNGFPGGNNKGGGGGPRNGPNKGGISDGDGIILRNVDKTPVRYKFIATNKNNGEYAITFISPINHDECYLCVDVVDDSNTKTALEIEEIVLNGTKIVSNNKTCYGPFDIKLNQKIKIQLRTLSQRGQFGCEVKVRCK